MQVKMQENHILETAVGTTIYDNAKELGLITREVIGAQVDGKTVALSYALQEGDKEVKLLTFADKAGKHVFSEVLPSMISPSRGIFPPALTQMMSPTFTSSQGISSSSPSSISTNAVSERMESRDLMELRLFPTAMLWNSSPT